MDRRDESKKIERRARAMLIGKEIPPNKQEVVRSLMNNAQLKPEEKYLAIIELLQTCPDKRVIIQEPATPVEPVKRAATRREKKARPVAPEIAAPTETSYYVDRLEAKYRPMKIFKRRYLTHRNNRIGIGFRKRLIPTKHLLRVMKYFEEAQGFLSAVLSRIMMEILKDNAVEEPILFNYLRLVRKWFVDTPLVNLRYDAIKWLERPQFERELRDWMASFFSFLKMDGETRERMLTEAEMRLRSLDDYKKDEHIEGEPEAYRKEKEKRNLEKEKKIHEFMLMMRSFLPIEAEQESMLSKRLDQRYGIGGFYPFLNAMAEALVFQRPISLQDIEIYFKIEAPFASVAAWDYSDDFLKKVGKDPESIQKKKRDSLRRDLEPYETLAMFLRSDDRGQNLLLKGAEAQWRQVDRRQHDPKTAYNENFLGFLDALVQCFKNLYLPLINGSAILFRDRGREEIEGSFFSFNYFGGRLERFEKILDELHLFRSNNPAYALRRDEVKRIMKGEGGQSVHVERLIRSIGDWFYEIGKELQGVYDMHRLWLAGRSAPPAGVPEREPLKDQSLAAEGERGMPLPFYDCVILKVGEGTALSKELAGRRVMEDSLYDGIFVRMAAFALQTAHECLNESLARDLVTRKELLKKMESAPE